LELDNRRIEINEGGEGGGKEDRVFWKHIIDHREYMNDPKIKKIIEEGAEKRDYEEKIKKAEKVQIGK